ncbi:hypothetical protein [Flavobacterium tyrosinilyticum]|uniref:hypothetical protein n=1 Tax=Flavobacterium tyrosinilyticum TaxID=1658740 RepID=UPI00202EF54D|nr:hypothetical protein [Flavobacterium tyrosinilyticum]MCM0667249.1 hypothetical protein [Flavobacterium tyrosinilyticum]
MNIPCILIPALVGLICGILGYLLGKMNSKGTDNSKSLTLKSDLDICRSNTQKLNAKIKSLEEDLDICKGNSLNLKGKISELERAGENRIQSFTKDISASTFFDSELFFTVFGKRTKLNDLKVIEGIGPKIEELFHKAGITTWYALSEASVEKCQAILNNGGENFSIHNPGTWPTQAELAYKGKWQDLKDWQDILDGGKE